MQSKIMWDDRKKNEKKKKSYSCNLTYKMVSFIVYPQLRHIHGFEHRTKLYIDCFIFTYWATINDDANN